MMKTRLILVLLLLTYSGAIGVARAGDAEDAAEAIRRGNERYARGEYDAAVKEYEQVAEEKGAVYAQALYNIGVCYFELNRTDESIAMYRRAIEARGGRYPKALYALGIALEMSGRLGEAKEVYGRAIAISDGKYAEAGLAVAHYRLGLIAGSEGRYESAAALFREALARSKERFPAAHNNLGVMLALAGRITEAEREFEIALRQSSTDFEEAAYNLKLCRSRLSKETQVALASLKIANMTSVLNR
ncbi:MAG TPA: tetratricopeptide repeat protein [Pyrinomonadaceae bacterium]|jgi:tetratricopeptide (TPR) repeat protein|nr:tetratricopeptide repeat protein [Pyrinomonadaceae bacterium]